MFGIVEEYNSTKINIYSKMIAPPSSLPALREGLSKGNVEATHWVPTISADLFIYPMVHIAYRLV